VARPYVRAFVRPTSLTSYPIGPCFTAGHLVETNAAWRSERPLVFATRCNACLRCYLSCPDGAIVLEGSTVRVDYDFCKGCGVCARECAGHAIEMSPEPRTGGRG
jgi:pyruvate ferredoxin oxidoreductase delta subunit